MKRIEKLLLDSCAFSVLITGTFFIFAKLTAPEMTPAVEIGRYFLILLFSLLIMSAGLLFESKKLSKPVAFLAHFGISYVAFLVIFVDFTEMLPMRFFIYTVIFIVAYAIYFAACRGIRKLVQKLDNRFSTKKAKPSEKYVPRYK